MFKNIKRLIVVGAIGLQLPLAMVAAPAAFAQTATSAPSTSADSSPSASTSASAAASSSGKAAGTQLDGAQVDNSDIFANLFSVFMTLLVRIGFFLGTVAVAWNALRLQLHSMGGGPGSVAHIMHALISVACGVVMLVLAPALVNGMGHMLSGFWHPHMTMPSVYCTAADITACP